MSKTKALLHVLDPLGGENNLVLMCEARDFTYILADRDVWFKVKDFDVYLITRYYDLFNKQVWDMRINWRNCLLSNTFCITDYRLVGRIFEHNTGYRLWF